MSEREDTESMADQAPRSQAEHRPGLHQSWGGTLSTQGMAFVNRCSWAHCLRETARLLHVPEEALLTHEEREALDGKRSPHGVIIPDVFE